MKLQITIEIANLPRASLESGNVDDLTNEDIQALAAQLLNAYQLSELDGILGITILSMEMVAPPPGSDTPEWQVYTEVEVSD